MAGFLSNEVPTFYPTDEEASDFEGLIHFMEQSGVHKVEFLGLDFWVVTHVMLQVKVA